MKKTNILIVVVAGFFLTTMQVYAQKGTVSIETLLKEMVDRSERAKFPDPAFTCKQFSSYDRATVTKGEPGWFANDDRSMFIRVEKANGRREFVMMDTEGPGAIVRFWMTFSGKNCGRGTMRIYIDDYSKPAIEGSAFDILSGNIVTTAPLAASVSELSPYENRGHDLYFPIPYAKRCKITYESENLYEDDPGARRRETEAVYYNINYRTYDPSVAVVSYSSSEMKKNQKLITTVQTQLKNKERGIEKMKLSKTDLNTTIKVGGSKSVVIKGSNAIQQLSMQLSAANKEQALRSTVLEITFDGEKTVWSPVGDFFGIGYQQLYTSTWYTSAAKDGLMSAFWVMPFEKECIITFHNLGTQDIQVSNAFAACNKWQWNNRSMHFGTTWQQYTRIYPGRGDEDAIDVNFANLKGKGIYVGDGVALFNTAHAWWGEGDEKVYVDGEKFPSHIGTGTEDYYGYAWCRPETFTDHPFIAQPCGKGSFDPDYTINTRFRGLDGIPFNTSIQFDLELWHWAKTRMNYAPVSFWYMIPGGQKLTKEDVAGAKEPVVLKRSDTYSPQLLLTLEAENMIPQTVTGGKVEFQTDFNHIWSDEMQVYWRDIQKGNKAVFEFDSNFTGSYTLSAIFTIAPDYGTFNVFVNDKQLASGIDLYNGKVAVREIKLGTVDLKKGKNILTIELAGYPKGFMKSCFGIDKLILN